MFLLKAFKWLLYVEIAFLGSLMIDVIYRDKNFYLFLAVSLVFGLNTLSRLGLHEANDGDRFFILVFRITQALNIITLTLNYILGDQKTAIFILPIYFSSLLALIYNFKIKNSRKEKISFRVRQLKSALALTTIINITALILLNLI